MDGHGVRRHTGHIVEPNGEMGAEEVKNNQPNESRCSEACGHCQIRGEEDPEGVGGGKANGGEKHHAGLGGKRS